MMTDHGWRDRRENGNALRMARIKSEGTSAVYHCISRVVGGQMLLDDLGKKKLVQIFGKLLESIRNELRAALGHIHGHVFEHEDSGRSCRIVLRSTGAKFREFVEDAQWWRKITFFDERPRFETFTEAFENFQPLGVRIFVLSLQIVGHIWSHAHRRQVARNAWTARTLDILSREYGVVFVTITGNVSPNEVGDLLERSSFPTHLLSPLAKVLDPGPAALAITVGSVAQSARVIIAPLSAIAEPGQPSPFTRSGPGFGDSIKPDFVERGGNLVLDSQSGTVQANAGTNVVMASGKLTPALQQQHGTSFAAPRVAHQLAVILRDLKALGIEPSAPLLRAMLGASAARPAGSEMLEDKARNLALAATFY